MTLKRELSWILLIKLIAITAIWYVWFSGPHEQVQISNLFNSSSHYSENQDQTPSKVR